MTTPHARLLYDVRLALGSVPGLVLWPCVSGVFQAPNGATVKTGLGDGAADLVGCYRGRFVALEVKAGRDRHRENQRDWQACVRTNGGVCEVVHSVDEARNVISAIAGTITIDPPDRRERCASCSKPFEPHTRQVVRELGGHERAWHLFCYGEQSK
jgi:hypothetical protein